MSTIHIDKIRATLRRHASYLPPVLVDDLARGFQKDGLAHDNDDGGQVVLHASAATAKLDRLAAAMADPARSVPARFAYHALRRAGVDLAILNTDPVQISNAMRERGVNADDRFAVKVALHRAGVLA